MKGAAQESERGDNEQRDHRQFLFAAGGVKHRMVHELHAAGEERLRHLRRLPSTGARFSGPIEVRFSVLQQEDRSYTSNG